MLFGTLADITPETVTTVSLKSGGRLCNVHVVEAACLQKNSTISSAPSMPGNVPVAENCLILPYWLTEPAATIPIWVDPIYK